MSSPSEKLAESLVVLKALQDQGKIAIHTSDISRVHRDRLIKNGFLQRVMKGWYIPSSPKEPAGESTAWYASFWPFCAVYLNERFKKKWCLSPEQSLSLHVGNWTVPKQLLVRSPIANNKVTSLLHHTSLLDVQYRMPPLEEIVEIQGLRVYSLSAALLACAPRYFVQHPFDLRAALFMINDASDILRLLLKGDHSVIAGRLAGAFRNVGREKIADEILKTMGSIGYSVRENNPFENIPALSLLTRERSPYINRMNLMWNDMRNIIIKHFPKASKKSTDIKTYMEHVEETYIADAYHSLSIEGYRVSPSLIERVRNKSWNPDGNEDDREHKNALAARGYWQAFQAVKKSVRQVLKGVNPGRIVQKDHSDWYRELFGPSVMAGVLKPVDLAGYRNAPVFIRQSMHVPPSREAVRELMPAFFDLLKNEQEPSVRIVLGHFFFVYIHPYFDGNGRIGRFLMNVMLAAGGYPWTIIPVEKRHTYMTSLEEASIQQNILPFTKFIASLVEDGLKGKIVKVSQCI